MYHTSSFAVPVKLLHVSAGMDSVAPATSPVVGLQLLFTTRLMAPKQSSLAGCASACVVKASDAEISAKVEDCFSTRIFGAIRKLPNERDPQHGDLSRVSSRRPGGVAGDPAIRDPVRCAALHVMGYIVFTSIASRCSRSRE